MRWTAMPTPRVRAEACPRARWLLPALVCVGGSGCGPASLPLGFSFDVTADEIFFTPEQRAASGLQYFPDGLGSIHRDDGTYTLFLPNGGDELDPMQGTHRFTATDLDSFDSLVPSSAQAVLTSGTLVPGPDDFDQYYAGGGSVIRLDDPASLVHVYYGEYHWDEAEWFNFYGSNGLAVSQDGGMTWDKRGEVLRVRRPRDDRQVVGSTASARVRDGFVYLYYQDQDLEAANTHPSIAVARADLADLTATGTLRVEKLYEGAFSEPGISGRFTPIAQDPGDPQSQGGVSVMPNDWLDRDLMVHVVYQRDGSWTLSLRASDDGLVWSEAATLGNGTPENRLGYPMLMGLGDDPNVLGQTFQLWYIDRFGDWSEARWRRMTLRVR